MFVILDLRKRSDTYGQWIKCVVSLEKRNVMFIPRGCALAMCSLSDECHLLYKMDSPFSPKHYDSIRWNDPALNIDWPVDNPTISEKDIISQSLKEFTDKYGGL